MIEISAKTICKLIEEGLLPTFLKMEEGCRQNDSIPLSESDKAVEDRAEKMNIELFNNSVICINAYLKKGYRRFDIYINVLDMVRGIGLINDYHIANIKYKKLNCKQSNELDKELHGIGNRTGYFFCPKPYVFNFAFKRCKHC